MASPPTGLPSPRLTARDATAEAVAGIVQRPGRAMLTMLGTVLGVGAFVAVLGLTATGAGQISHQFTVLEDTTVTAFVLDTVTSRAKRVVKQHRDLVLSNQAFDRFIAELDKPAKPVPELVDLFKNNPKLREA